MKLVLGCAAILFPAVVALAGTAPKPEVLSGKAGASSSLSAEFEHSLQTASMAAGSELFAARNPGVKLFEPSAAGTRQISNASSLFKKCAPGVVALLSPDLSSLGSGSVIDDQGTILTNWHVVEGQKEMYVLPYDPAFSTWDDVAPNDMQLGQVVATDSHRDLALVRVQSRQKLPVLKFGDEGTLEVAQDVFAVGHPMEALWTYTYGSISQIRPGYTWSYGSGRDCKADIIQTQTPINPGNSGGPLFDEDGKIIGVNTFITQASEGLNYAVSVRECRDFVAGAAAGRFPVEQATTAPGPATPADSTARIIAPGSSADTDGDGVNDFFGYDSNGNGAVDGYTFDSNEDGVVDAIVIDANEDGKADAELWDLDLNGTYEYWLLDENGDGTYETQAWDDNGDMNLDRREPYQG